MTTRLVSATDDALLVDVLERGVVPKLFERGSVIVALERDPSPATTSYRSEVLSIELAGGERLKVFLKDFCHSRLPKDALEERRKRELGVYRDLIGLSDDVGTASYYGAIWDERRARYWLLLEFVEGVELRSCDVDLWPLAAGWLGRMQGHFAQLGEFSGSYGFLQRHDAEFFRSKGKRALNSAAHFSAGLARRLTKVLDRYERLIDVMASEPWTLVHGAYRPGNILLDMRQDPPRICPVDWELAAIGSPLYDLAFFCDGFEPPMLDRFWDAYSEEATKAGIALRGREKMSYVVDCFRLFRVIAWLAPALDKRYSADDVERLVSRGESLITLFEADAEMGSTKLEAMGVDQGFRARLERTLQRALGQRVEVASLERAPSRFATLFPAEVLTIELVGGQRIELFLKHLGEEEQRDHPEKRCREREVRVYERLLRDPTLPVVRFYGSEWNETSRRFELFLEHVDDLTLNYQGLEHWLEAARRLARFHAYFARRAEELLTCDFLLRIDALHFRAWADRAVEAVGSRSTDLAAKLEQVVDRYDPVVELLAAQPITLVHNDLSPKNVIADRSTRPARICVIDWEMAGIGCGVIDIVHLKYGLDEKDDRKMRAAYCDELVGTGLIPVERDDRRSVFAACELHRTLHRLAHVDGWRTPIETVDRWVIDARRLRMSV